jgi:Tol biopolymer transport system component
MEVLPFTGQPAFAVDGKMAFMNYDAEHKIQLTLVNGEKTFTFSIPGNRLVDMSWSPDGNTLAISTSAASTYSGRVLESKLFLVTWPTDVDIALIYTDVVPEQHIWSPDGTSIVAVRRKMEDGKYYVSL